MKPWCGRATPGIKRKSSHSRGGGDRMVAALPKSPLMPGVETMQTKNTKRLPADAWPTHPVGTSSDLMEIVKLIVGTGDSDVDPEDVADRVIFAAKDLLDHLGRIQKSSTKPEQLK